MVAAPGVEPMPNPVHGQAMNAPIWNQNTTVQIVALTGAYDAITVTGYYVVISNVGANDVHVGPVNGTTGVRVPPAASFETAISPGSPIFVLGTAAQAVSVVEYKA